MGMYIAFIIYLWKKFEKQNNYSFVLEPYSYYKFFKKG